jgi:protein gp37
MGENSAIAWTDHTFNPWWGCTKVSPGCDRCYAESWSKRAGYSDLWEGNRRVMSDDYWKGPLKWEKKAAAGEIRLENGVWTYPPRPRVFCASMADVFDKDAPQFQRERLWSLIKRTHHLDWLVLTKRVGNVLRMLPRDWDTGYPNVWLGISVVNQEEYDRDVVKLLEIPAKKRFLSCEPLIGPIRLVPNGPGTGLYYWLSDGLLDWIIVGGESGYGARPMQVSWVRDIREDCEEYPISFFMKQGSAANWGGAFKDIESFPEDLRVRRFPTDTGL